MEQDETEPILARPQLKIPLVGAGIGLIGVLFTLTTLTPSSGPMTILLFLALVFLVFLALAAVSVQIIGHTILKRHYSWPRVLYTAVLISAGGIFLVGLQTLGQLQAIDVVLVIVFEALLNFYIFRRF
jgi:hypothetical protein